MANQYWAVYDPPDSMPVLYEDRSLASEDANASRARGFSVLGPLSVVVVCEREHDAARAIVDAYRSMYPKHDLIRRYDAATQGDNID